MSDDKIIELPGANMKCPERTSRLAGDKDIQLGMAELITDVASTEAFISLVVMGINPNGTLFLATDPSDIAGTLLLMKRIERHLMETFYHNEVFQ